jgi:metallo-beta-lactamase class B
MFAELSAALLLGAAQILPVVIPLDRPRRVERPVAPIEVAGRAFAAECRDSDATPQSWDKPAPPVRIFGNTYLVGTCGISAVLITGNAGHILIDAGTEQGADLIAENIRRLGFRLQDVKILLHSHEHLDHVGGMSRLQRLTGAQLVASPAAARVFETGAAGPGDPQAGMHPPFPAARVDRVIQDGGEVRLGELAIVAIATPGHTPGGLSWHWGSCQGGLCRRIVYADSLSPISSDRYRFSDHPAYLQDYRASLAKVAAVECDILLTPHPSASRMIERLAGREPLMNSNACRDYSESLGKRLDERLAQEGTGQ